MLFRSTITIVNGAAEGATYIVESNLADAGSDDVVFTLDRPLLEALTATDDCIIVPSPYTDVVLASDLVGAPLGVAQTKVDPATDTGTTYAWFWVQTKGPGSVLVATAAGLIEGLAVMVSANASPGGIQASDGTHGEVGIMLNQAAVTDGDLAPICITCG